MEHVTEELASRMQGVGEQLQHVGHELTDALGKVGTVVTECPPCPDTKQQEPVSGTALHDLRNPSGACFVVGLDPAHRPGLLW